MVQRKIHHILKSSGNGKDFHYLPELAIQFELDQIILVTEKVDGSTLQAKGGELYKRYDNFSKNDPRKQTATEQERYRLDKCSRSNPSEKWYWQSFDAYRPQFERLGLHHPDIWVYFEALGSKIGARYPGLGPTVRVFDAGTETAFEPFRGAGEVADAYALPMVFYYYRQFSGLEHLLADLQSAVSGDIGLPEHKLEGWVLRQGDLIGKIRVADLNKLEGR